MRWAIALIALVALAAGPTTRTATKPTTKPAKMPAALPRAAKVDYPSLRALLLAIPKDVMPPPGRRWDDLFIRKFNKWFQDHAVGKRFRESAYVYRVSLEKPKPSTTPAAAPQPEVIVITLGWRSDRRSHDPPVAPTRFVNVTLNSKEMSIMASAKLAPGQEKLVERLMDYQAIEVIGVIEDVAAYGGPGLVYIDIAIKDATLKRGR